MEGEHLPEGVYEVIAQSPMTRYDTGGDPQKGIEVRFKIPGLEAIGSVFIPGEYPDAEAAQLAIRTYVARAYEVAELNN